jgi:RNA polymerase primary sigma factor
MIPPDIEQLSELEIARLFRNLETHEKNILKMRFGLVGEQKKTLTEVATNLGLPVESVRKIELQAMEQLGWITIAD